MSNVMQSFYNTPDFYWKRQAQIIKGCSSTIDAEFVYMKRHRILFFVFLVCFLFCENKAINKFNTKHHGDTTLRSYYIFLPFPFLLCFKVTCHSLTMEILSKINIEYFKSYFNYFLQILSLILEHIVF